MLQHRAKAIFSAMLVLAASASLALAGDSYSEAELQKAREFITTKLRADKSYMLEELAKKSGKTPEVMFLDIAKLTGDDTLGTGPRKPNIPASTKKDAAKKPGLTGVPDPIIGVNPKKPNIPGTPPAGGGN